MDHIALASSHTKFLLSNLKWKIKAYVSCESQSLILEGKGMELKISLLLYA